MTWLPPENSPVMVLRFLGTSPDSSSVIPLLTSLCRQIAVNYGEPLEDVPGELSPLVQHLKRLLASATEQKPLLIFLDSLDQLSAADGAHRLSWLPSVLPQHVRIVVCDTPLAFVLSPMVGAKMYFYSSGMCQEKGVYACHYQGQQRSILPLMYTTSFGCTCFTCLTFILVIGT